MALVYRWPSIQGTNSDRTGGTWTNLPAGWIFFETDTGNTYYWTGSAWTYMSGRPRITFNQIFGASASSQYVARFLPFGATFLTSTESLVQMTFPHAFTVTRALVKMNTNGLNGSSVFAFRDDAADVTGTALTVTAGSTTEVDSGVLSVAVAAGSKINFRLDTSASASGTWLMSHYYVIAELNL